MKIGGILDLSTIDFPGKLCSVVFLSTCPFRCPYCHNYELLFNWKEVGIEEIVKAVEGNYLVDGVCVTGGEPFHQDVLKLLEKLKEIKAVKVDTNGYYPERLKKALNFIDYVAIDLKTSPEKYSELTGKMDSWDRVEKSIEILSNSEVEWEIRTTAIPGIVWEEELKRIREVLDDLNVKTKLVLQQFRNEKVLDSNFKKIQPPSVKELKTLALKYGYNTVRSGEGEFKV